MKKLEVLIQDSTTLILEEDGKKGDLIDLNELMKVDQKPIFDAIQKSKDDIYKRLLNEARVKFELESQNKLMELQNKTSKEMEDLKFELQSKKDSIKFLESQISKEKEQTRIEIVSLKNDEFAKEKENYTQKLFQLQSEIDKLKMEKTQSIEIFKQQKEIEFQKEVSRLNNVISSLEERIKAVTESSKLEIENKQLQLSKTFDEKVLTKDQEILELKNTLDQSLFKHQANLNDMETKYQKELQNKDLELELIKREKALRNVKQIGEDLENWCNEQYKAVSLFGFRTSTWEKDNLSIKSESETKGTKGDYIFKVYNDDNHSTLLTSAMCEMKSESLNSEYTKKNADHYKKLDQDRNKKNLDYAILISELEYNVESDAPIYMVPDYPKMFVVRPQYFITLLGIIESIGMKYSSLIEQKEAERITFKESTEILSEFEVFKNNLLENSIKNIQTHIQKIKDSAQKIVGQADDILKSADIITDSHLKTVQNKIENFQIKKIVNKLP